MKKVFILIIISLSVFSCSRLSDELWNPEAADFNLTINRSGDDIIITIPRTDHATSIRDETSDTDGPYFWGYYVYRNNSTPYETYYHIGTSAQETLHDPSTFLEDNVTGVHDEFTEGGVSDANPGEYTDVGRCSANVGTFYYRVVVVYREWNSDDSRWSSEVEAKSRSAWVACDCSQSDCGLVGN